MLALPSFHLLTDIQYFTYNLQALCQNTKLAQPNDITAKRLYDDKPLDAQTQAFDK
jgi:hypothetical protein